MPAPRKAPAGARKRPSQERSRATVERLVEAATRVLATDGYHRASTNRIAAEAGLSPGTLYQYFANKDELVGAVIDGVVEAFTEAIAPVLRASAGKPPAEGTRAVLDAILLHLEPRAPLLDALVDRVPGEQYQAAIVDLRSRVSDVVFHLMAAQRPDLGHEELDRRTWMLVSVVLNITIRYLLDRPPIAREDFAADLTRIVVTIGLS